MDSHSYKFKLMTSNTGKRKLIYERFLAGGYEWVIDFHPNSTRIKDDQYISLFITLETTANYVIARFELILVDRNRKMKHRIQTNFGMHASCLLQNQVQVKHQGSHWSFRQLLKKTQLQKSSSYSDQVKESGDGYLAVNCKFGVLEIMNWKESESYSPLAGDQVQDLEPIYSPLAVDHVKESEYSNLGNTEVRTARIIFDTGLGVKFDGEHDEFEHYFHAVYEIQESYESKGVNLLQMTTQKLVAAFRNISDWSSNTDEADDLSSTDGSSFSQELQEGGPIGHGALSSQKIYHLRCITERLNSTGQLQECIEVYNISRKTLIHASILRLGMGNWGFTDIRSLDRTAFARMIRVWIRAAQMCFLIIFPREKQYYETIFDGLKDVTYDNCFLVIVKDIAIQLCNYAETIATSPVSPGKLFDVLDMYKFLLLYLPDIKSIFQSASTERICAQAERTLNRLATLIREILLSFEEVVLHEQLNTPISRGTLHSMTRYVMNYLTKMVHYNELLTEIIISGPTTSLVATSDMKFLKVRGRKPLAIHLLWIIISLKFNLKIKFKEYKDINLAHLFFMNNLHYIVERIKRSYELVEMIGQDYATKLSKDVLEEARSYLGSWDKVLYCLRDEQLYYKVFPNGVSNNIFKERIKSFNATFEEVLQTQLTWFVPDLKLRNQIWQMILSKLIPEYRSFVEKFSSQMENGRHKDRYIKYSTEELENKIHSMFVEQ